MLKTALKGLLAHKLRLLLSAVAVVLGVAFLSGSLIFTDTLSKTFTEVVEGTSADVTVQRETAFDQSVVTAAAAGAANAVPASVLEEVRDVEGVAAAEGDVLVQGVYVVDEDGDAIGGTGAPGLGTIWSESPDLTSSTMEEGSPPEGPGQVALDTATAEKGGFSVGDTARVLTPEGATEAEVVGIFSFGESGSLAGASLTVFDTATAQSLLGLEDAFSSVVVAAEEGVSEEELRGRIAEVLPEGYEALTRSEVVDQGVAEIESALSFINIFLLVFAGIALFVGSFIILNTFSMIVAQRSRELALLRAIGASRRQVTWSVLVEAFVVGLVGAVLGLGVGVGLASLLRWVFGRVGLELEAGLVLQTSTVVWSVVVGVVVTLVASYLPARRASRVPPVAAMRDDTAMPERSLRVRAVVGTVLAAAGALSLGGGLATDDGSTAASLVGLGALLLILGAITLSPVLARPALALLAGWYPRAFGAVGRLAQENSRRNPRRTSATASALMVGLALVATMSVLGASMKASIDALVDRALGADFVVANAVGTPFSTEVAQQVREVEGVETVAAQRFAAAQVDGSDVWLSGIDPQAFDEALTATWVEGSADGVREGGVVLDEPTAEARGVGVGDTLALTFPYGGTRELTVAGVYERNDALGPYALSLDTFSDVGFADLDNYLYVVIEDGTQAGAVAERVEAVTGQYPIVSLQDQTEFKEDITGQVNQLLTIVYGLLALAVIIAVLGIVNTLALSVIGRTREIGLLRAVGMARRQLRRMIRLESVVIALYGAVLGLVLGLVFGVALQRALAGQGIEELRVPVVQLLVFLVLAALVGVLAAVWPARRAARLDVLRAITTE